MRVSNTMGAALLPLTITLAACSGSQPQPAAQATGKAAYHIYIVDVSASTATQNDPVVASAVERWIGADIKRAVHLGDTLTVFRAGSADVARMVGLPTIATGYNLRIPAAQTKLVGQLHDIADDYRSHGGDNATHLTEAIEAIRPDCSSGRDTITVITDGLEENGQMSSARALAAGQPVTLRTPPRGFLAGCSVHFLGFALTDDGNGKESLLPAPQLAALQQGWLDYLTAAGVRAQDVEFISVL